MKNENGWYFLISKMSHKKIIFWIFIDEQLNNKWIKNKIWLTMQFIVKDVLISLDSSQLCFFEKSSAFLYRFQFIRRPMGACKSQPIVPPSGAEFVDYIFGLLTFFANPEPKTCLVSGFYRTSFIRRSAKKDYVIRLKFTTFRYSIYFFDSVE